MRGFIIYNMCATKKCNKCDLEKSVSDFHKAVREVNGLCPTCKECKKKKLLSNTEVLVEPKKCIACLIEKPLLEFVKDKYVVGGYKRKCKQCVRDKVKAYQVEEGYKVCTKCLIKKKLSDFTKDRSSTDGLLTTCRNCENSEEMKAKKALYYLENKDKLQSQQKQNYTLKKDEYLLRALKYVLNNEEKVKDYKKEWAENNKEKTNVRRKDRIQEDELYKLRTALYGNIHTNFKRFIEGKKKRKTLELIGCSLEEFKLHLESQFLNWMSWDNYGNVCEILTYNCSWDLDHIIPLSSAQTEEEVYLLNHWSNFQPLCSKINRNYKKGKVPLVTNLELNITTTKCQKLK